MLMTLMASAGPLSITMGTLLLNAATGAAAACVAALVLVAPPPPPHAASKKHSPATSRLTADKEVLADRSVVPVCWIARCMMGDSFIGVPYSMLPVLKPDGNALGIQARPVKARMWPLETMTTSGRSTASWEWPALGCCAAALVMVSNCSPSKVRKSGRKGPFQLTANTTPLALLYSRTTVPLSSLVWLTV